MLESCVISWSYIQADTAISAVMLLLATTSLLLLLSHSTNANDGAAFNITIGDVDGDSQEIGNGFSTSIIATNLVIPSIGRIRLLAFRIGSKEVNSSVYLQVWRGIEGSQYRLTRNKKLKSFKIGLNEVAVNWIVPAGDIVGLSCNGYCPVMRGPSDPDYKSKVSMSDDLADFQKYSNRSFSDPDLMGKIALKAILEVNGSPDPGETTPPIMPTLPDSTPSFTTPPSGKAGGSSSSSVDATTEKGITANSPETQTSTLGVWWILVAAAVVVVLLSLALVLVSACRFGRERSDLKKQLVAVRSRSTSGLSRDRPMSGASNDFNTLARNNPGLSGADEIVMVNEQETAHSQSEETGVDLAYAVTSVSPEGRKAEPTVVFDSGVRGVLCPSPTFPPPPLHMPPLSSMK